MSNACLAIASEQNGTPLRIASKGASPMVLTDIYQDAVNIAIWQRKLPTELLGSLQQYLQSNPRLSITKTIEADAIELQLRETLPDFPGNELLQAKVAELVDMFCCLFDLKRAGLRLKVLEHAMCPRFHVDRVPCRLVTTFYGAGTQWLPHQLVNRDRLGIKSQGLADEQSGLYSGQDCIQVLAAGDVALLKGELWQGNEHAGLVHRSAPASGAEKRLLLTLDFVF